MKPSQNRWLGWVGIIALFIGIQFASGRNLASGEPPPLAGTTLDGAGFELSQWRGKPAVIYFWAEWCPICRGMQPQVKAIAQDYPLISVAMQSGSATEVAQYQRKQDFQVPTLLDEDGGIAQRYGLRGVPALFVLDAEGKIRYATTGYTSKLGILARLWLAGR